MRRLFAAGVFLWMLALQQAVAEMGRCRIVLRGVEPEDTGPTMS